MAAHLRILAILLTSALFVFLAVLAVSSLHVCPSVVVVLDKEGHGGGEWVVHSW